MFIFSSMKAKPSSQGLFLNLLDIDPQPEDHFFLKYGIEFKLLEREGRDTHDTKHCTYRAEGMK
jgi:hypothetical protein